MNPKYPFQFAVKKYGTANFKRTTLYTFNTEDEAYAKERELVDLKFVQHSDTYNCILGGNIRPLFYNRYKIYQFNINGSFVGEFESINKMCKELNLDNSTVNKVLRGVNKSTKGYTLKIKDIV